MFAFEIKCAPNRFANIFGMTVTIVQSKMCEYLAMISFIGRLSHMLAYNDCPCSNIVFTPSHRTRTDVRAAGKRDPSSLLTPPAESRRLRARLANSLCPRLCPLTTLTQLKGLHFPGAQNTHFCRVVLKRSRHLLQPVRSCSCRVDA